MQRFSFSDFIFLLLFSIAKKVAKKSRPDRIFNAEKTLKILNCINSL
jgi:hypothetical protein